MCRAASLSGRPAHWCGTPRAADILCSRRAATRPAAPCIARLQWLRRVGVCLPPARRPLVRVGTWFDCCRVASDCRVCNNNNGNADVLNKQPDRRKAPPGRRITPCRAPAAPQALDRANANSQTIRTLRSDRTGRCLRALLRARAPTPLHNASPQPLLGLISARLHARSPGTQQPRLGSGQPRCRHRPGRQSWPCRP